MAKKLANLKIPGTTSSGGVMSPTKISSSGGGLTLELTGGWNAAINLLSKLVRDIKPEYTAQLNEDAELVLKKLQGHIDAQDLGWAPLSDTTVALKGGDTTILVETGTLRNSMKVKRISAGDIAFFVGPDGTEPRTGVSSQQLMLWIEGGTDRMPPRPLLKPTLDEVKDILKRHWKEILKGLF